MSLDGYLTVTVDSAAVEFVFTVRNENTEAVDLEFRSGKMTDVAVSKAGVEVWSWSEGQMFTQAIQTETLGPGKSFTHEMIWNDPPRGEYTAAASLEATNATLVKRATFEVS